MKDNLVNNSVTLIDVADKTGVSMMTVSAALRGVGRMADKTREQVLKEAQNLGYCPNAAARSIRSGRFGCIAILLSIHPDSWRAFKYNLLDGIETVLEQENLHLVVNRLPAQQLTDAGYIPKMLREATADGLLIKYDQNIPAKMIELINKNRIPAIWMNSKQTGDCIYPDEIAAGRIATERLLELGHKKIGYLCYSGRGHYNVIDRFKGYKAAMLQAGLPAIWIDDQYIQIPRNERGALMRKWLQNPDRPTAIIAPSTCAKILLYTTAAIGIRIPDDLSVITFSNEPEDDIGIPLDTVITPYYELGLKAAEMLLEKIKDRTKIFTPRILTSKIISGASTASVNKQSR